MEEVESLAIEDVVEGDEVELDVIELEEKLGEKDGVDEVTKIEVDTSTNAEGEAVEIEETVEKEGTVKEDDVVTADDELEAKVDEVKLVLEFNADGPDVEVDVEAFR